MLSADHIAEIALIDATSRAQREAFRALQPRILNRWAAVCANAGQYETARELASIAHSDLKN